MRDRLRQLDPGYAVVLAVCLLAIWPFLSRPGLPVETDAELHVYRLAELARLVRGGEFYPRWAPNFYFGYGYPIFNYYAPLVYYLGLPVALLPFFDAVVAVKAVFVLGLLAAGLGMYGFVRDNWGRPAAFVAAAVYVYAPYIHFVDPHMRGDLAEAFSFGVFPLALWALDRLWRSGSAAASLAAVTLVAAVILAHNLMAMVFFGLLLAWALWRVCGPALFRLRRCERPDPAAPSAGRARSLLLFLALLLGVGLAAFFWLPVGLEQDAVNLSSLIGDGSHFDFRNHFLSLGELFAPSRLLDWGATEPDFRFNLGLAQWMLAAVGLVALLTGRARRPFHAAFFAVAAVALVFLMTPASTFLWEWIPLLPYLQFPWRLLGATVAFLAVLGGVGADAILRATADRSASARQWLPAVLVAPVLLLALPLVQVPPWPGVHWDTSPGGVARVEMRGRWLGTTSTADFVPATVDVIPDPNEQLVRDLLEGRPPDRVNRETLPEGATVDGRYLTPLHARYQTSSPRDFLLRLFQFDFPGWQARVDGDVVDTELARPEGFLVVPVPAGEHVVEVEFVATTARRLAWAVSSLSLALALFVALALWRTGPGPAGPRQESAPATATGATRPVLAVALLITALYALVLAPTGWLRYHSQGVVALPAEHDVYADFGGQIALLGYDAPAVAGSGETIEVTLYWKAQRDLDINFQVFVHLLGPDGGIVAQSDKLNPGAFPTRRWPLDRYVRDRHTLSLPSDAPPGSHPISVGLWVQAEGWRLPLFDEDEQQIDDSFVIDYLQIEE
ncbi:MAG: hypothetical protein R3248_01260 [Candidatus Promineifilaceae bacterium]|nr:hypothetical protein [Candidatus Promineifilaceae bacterium]